MKKRKILLICSVFFLPFCLEGQMLISTAGSFAAGSSASLSWSVGEIVTETAGTSTVLTQGFQQPISVTPVKMLNAENWEVIAYPNPVAASLQVKINDINDELMLFNLTDVSGKEIKAGLIKCDIEIINLSDIPEGMYLLTIQNKAGTRMKTCKIMKVNN